MAMRRRRRGFLPPTRRMRNAARTGDPLSASNPGRRSTAQPLTDQRPRTAPRPAPQGARGGYGVGPTGQMGIGQNFSVPGVTSGQDVFDLDDIPVFPGQRNFGRSMPGDLAPGVSMHEPAINPDGTPADIWAGVNQPQVAEGDVMWWRLPEPSSAVFARPEGGNRFIGMDSQGRYFATGADLPPGVGMQQQVTPPTEGLGDRLLEGGMARWGSQIFDPAYEQSFGAAAPLIGAIHDVVNEYVAGLEANLGEGETSIDFSNNDVLAALDSLDWYNDAGVTFDTADPGSLTNFLNDFGAAYEEYGLDDATLVDMASDWIYRALPDALDSVRQTPNNEVQAMGLDNFDPNLGGDFDAWEDGPPDWFEEFMESIQAEEGEEVLPEEEVDPANAAIHTNYSYPFRSNLSY